MPLYEYRCKTHGLFDAFRPLAESKAPAACPTCGKASPRVLSLPRTRVLERATRIGMERNEKSRHEPRRLSASAGGHDGPHQGAGKGPEAPPQIKRSGGSRPWMMQNV